MDNSTPENTTPENTPEKKTRVTAKREVNGENRHFAKMVKLRRRELRLTQADLAKKVDVVQPTISKYELGQDIPDGKTLSRLADALGIPERELLGVGSTVALPEGRRVKLVGEIAAGVWRETIEHQDQRDVMVVLPKKYENVPLQAFTVSGESMNLIYPDGSIVYVAPIHSVEGWPRSGQVVMVMRHKHGETEATLKEYVVDAKGGKWLWPRSDHPEHQAPVDYKGKRTDEEVVIAGVVVAALVVAG